MSIQTNDVAILEKPMIIVNPNANFLSSKSEEMTLAQIQNNHIIPVFSVDNMPTISQAEFMQTTAAIAKDVFNESHTSLAVRLSHARKGRTFEARNKKAAELLEHEKTVYFERCAFLMEFPIANTIEGQEVFLTVAGVKAYNLDNLNRSGAKGRQHFKISVGFKVQVCTNLCMWADGANLDIEVKSLDALETEIRKVLTGYSEKAHLEAMRQFSEVEISEQQFATIIGKTRMYQHLPNEQRLLLPHFIISDTQINNVSRCYYKDPNFSAGANGSIDLWRFYNCITESVKSSYIDTFLDRSVNAFEFTNGIKGALLGDEKYQWFLN